MKQLESLPKIKGWVARDKKVNQFGTNLYFGYEKPNGLSGRQACLPAIWSFTDFLTLPKEMFPELSFDDEPIEVELTIKKI